MEADALFTHKFPHYECATLYFHGVIQSNFTPDDSKIEISLESIVFAIPYDAINDATESTAFLDSPFNLLSLGMRS